MGLGLSVGLCAGAARRVNSRGQQKLATVLAFFQNNRSDLFRLIILLSQDYTQTFPPIYFFNARYKGSYKFIFGLKIKATNN